MSARDRRRSGENRQPGDARGFVALSGQDRRAAQREAQRRHDLQHAAADPGLASLIILALYERLRVREAESFEFAHGLVEATKRAFRVRDRYRHRSACIAASAARFSNDKFLDAERPRSIAARRRNGRAPGEGDTIWMGAADSSGLAVSYIQSLYWEFGSGCVLPKTGVLMQNRGQLLARSEGAERAGARPPAVPHAQSRARRAQRRPRHGLRHDGRRRPAAVAGA
jgi:gamma-glutamyltranspeptidase/glutathione hydrolase